jgi:PAS domain S-box-containing protein
VVKPDTTINNYDKFQQSSEMLSAIFTLNPDGIFLTRASDGKYIDCNQEFLNQIGYSREEVIGHNSAEINLYNIEERQAYINEIQRKKNLYDYEMKIRRKDGTYINILYSGRFITINEELLILNIGKDITKRKKLEKNKQKLLEQVQLSNEELEVSNEDLQSTTEELTVSNEDLQSTTEELRVSNEELQQQGDELIHVNQMLRENEENLKRQAALLNVSYEAIFSWDYNKGILSWNQGAERLYGYNSKEAIGHVSHELLKTQHPLELDEFLEVLAKDKMWTGEITHTTKKGQKIIVETRQQLIKDKSGKKIVIETNRDITERKQTEVELAKYREQLEDMVGARTAELEDAYESLKESQEHYLTLFNSIDEGFCTIEVIFDVDDKPIDYRFLEINPAFEGQTGLIDAKGKLMRDLAPDHEEYWFEIYGKIALSGEPKRFVNEAKALNRWYDVYAFKIGDPECREVAILFNDITKFKKAEEELDNASKYNRSLIEASVDPLVTIGPDGKITDLNNSTELVTGYSREELIFTDFSDYFTEPQKAQAGYQQVFKEGFVRDYELEMKHKNGQITPVLYNASVYRDKEGEVVGVFAAARDITESKRTESEKQKLLENIQQFAEDLEASNEELQTTTDELQRANEELQTTTEELQATNEELRLAGAYTRSLIEASVDPLVTIGPDGKITDVNNSTEKVTGYNRDELIGTNFSDYFTEPEKAREGYKQVFREDFVRNYELEIKHRDGHLTPVVYNASVYKDDDGNVIGVFAAARDISERKRSEKELKMASNYNRSLIEASVDPLVTIGPDGKITDVNNSTEKVTGYNRDELIGTDFSDYFTEPEKAREGYKQVFQDGFVRDYELKIKHKNRNIIPVLYNASVYHDDDGEVIGVFAAARDITERKKVEEMLKLNIDELARSNAELEQFAYVSSHDLQEPLRMIGSYLQLLERRYEGQLDDKADKYIRFAVDGAYRMQHLINDLLEFSRVTTHAKDLEITNVESVYNQVLINLEVSMKENNAIITYDQFPEVMADDIQLSQVFQNLISNAIKFRGEDDPKIHIGLIRESEQWLFSVKDNGIGIDSKHKDRIFEVFKRLHKRRDYPGTGIGLSICKKIIERHGGNIWVESELGYGSVFYFTLPVKEV